MAYIHHTVPSTFDSNLLGCYHAYLNKLNANVFLPVALKKQLKDVDTLDRMIRIKLIDGSTMDIPRAEVREILPLPTLYYSSHLKPPASALFSRYGKAIVVEGPLPLKKDSSSKKMWLVLRGEKAYVTTELPIFMEDLKASAPPSLTIAQNSDEEEQELAKEIAQLEEMLKASA